MRVDKRTLPVIKEVDESKCVLLKKQWFIKDNGEAVYNKYQIEPNPIGEGAFGKVYKARMRGNQNIVRAIKKIDIKTQLNQTQVNRFINQIQFLKDLDHPNSVRLYETYQTENYIYLVMEFCGGGQLFDRVQKKGKLSQFQAKNIFRDLVIAVNYLQIKKICHRDLKLENVIYTCENPRKPGILKLIDFGLSAVINQNSASRLTSFVGTTCYVSPQVLKMNYHLKADIWSMGIILYMMTTGQSPHPSNLDKQIMASIARNNIRIPKYLSPSLQDLLNKIFVVQELRISASQILQHPWLIDTRKKSVVDPKISLHKLKKFANFSPLKKVILTIIASQVNSKDIEDLARLFIKLNTNHDGVLSPQEIFKGIRKQQLDRYNKKQLDEIFEGIDTDKSGKISYTQFLAAMMPKSIYIKPKNTRSFQDKPQYLKLAFDLIDKDGNGTIEFEELKQLIRVDSDINSIKEKQWLNIIKQVDSKKDGILTFDQFQNLLSN